MDKDTHISLLLSNVALKTHNAVTLMDYNGNIEWINNGYTELYGYTLERLISERGKSIFGKDIDPAIKVAFGKSIVHKQTVRYEAVNLKSSGEKIWTLSTITPVIENDNVIQLIIIDSDISKLKIAKNELKNQIEELKNISGEMENQNELLKARNADLEEKQEEIERQTEMLNAQAEYLNLVNIKLFKQKQILEKSYSNLKRIQNQLVQSEKMASLGQMTAGITHEIQSPINYISIRANKLKKSLLNLVALSDKYSKLQKEDYQKLRVLLKKEDLRKQYIKNKSDISELIEKIEIKAKSAIDIVKLLRIFSRLDENDSKFVEINQNIDSTLIMIRSQAKDRIKIITDYSNLPKVECMPGKINQVFMNILLNAVQAIENKGVITIKTSLIKTEENNFVAISVKDTGIGIDKNNIEKIFNPLYTTKHDNAGLGLSICNEIIKFHNGYFKVKSKKNIGTEFVVLLPVINSA